MEFQVKNREGLRYGRLLVVSAAGQDDKGRYLWLCHCDCGNEKVVIGQRLGRGYYSCGCLKKERWAKLISSHGLSKHPLYGIWAGIKQRCYDEKSDNYQYYGARGIAVCHEWEFDFERFYKDMLPGYKKGLTIERKDVCGPYSKDNCTWATQREQGWNKTNTRFITVDGLTKCVSEWADIKEISPKTIFTRLDRGFTEQESVYGRPSRRRGNISYTEFTNKNKQFKNV